MNSGFQGGPNQSAVKETRSSDARHSLLLGVGTTGCSLEQMTLLHVFSICPKGMQTGPDCTCAPSASKKMWY